MDKLIKEANLSDIENHPIGIKIDFNRFLKLKIKAKEIHQCYLTGITTIHNSFNRCNLVKCKAMNWTIKNGDLNAVDIKDCYLSDCFFDHTIFDNNAIINSIYKNVEFQNCSFHYSSITGTTFENVIFNKCDLCNLVMESCRFYNCSFIECKTSNKLIEQSFLFNSTFQSMTIDINTIIDNFGISEIHTTNVTIEDRNRYLKDTEQIDANKLRLLLNKNIYSKVDEFKIAYFLDYQILNIGGIHIDSIFEIQPWLEVCNNSATFSNTLVLFYEFLSYNYEHNNVMLWPLLKLYYLTSQLTEVVQINNHVSIYPMIMGIHMAAVRYVEEYYALVQEFTKQHLKLPVVLLVCSGPIDKDFYKKRLSPFFTNKEIEIVNVVKHNSPNELFIQLANITDSISNIPWKDLLEIGTDLITIYSFFFISRTKVQLDSIKDCVLKELANKINAKPSQGNIKNTSLLKKKRKEQNSIQILIEKPSDILDNTTKIQIIYPSKEKDNSPVLVEIHQSSHVICTVGNTIIDVLS